MTAYSDGEAHWTFLQDGEETAASIAAFEETVCRLMSALDEGDCETARAMLLYEGLTRDAVYDMAFFEKREVTVEEARLPNSAYSAIQYGSGVCLAYADALTFLYTQIGIDSLSVNGSAPDAFHQWVLARVEGELYYFDPTYDLGGGFHYFGLTTEERCSVWAGGYEADTIQAVGIAINGLYNPENTRFFTLHSTVAAGSCDFSFRHDTQTASFYHGTYTFSCVD